MGASLDAAGRAISFSHFRLLKPHSFPAHDRVSFRGEGRGRRRCKNRAFRVQVRRQIELAMTLREGERDREMGIRR